MKYQWHDLTKRILSDFTKRTGSNDHEWLVEEDDEVIRQWLSEKAKKLNTAWSSTYKAYNGQKVARKLTEEILGLSSEEPNIPMVDCHCGQCSGKEPVSGFHTFWPKKEEKYQECVDNQCPCMRHMLKKEKTLAEKFSEYMNSFSTHILVKHYHDKENRTTDEQVFHKAQFDFVSSKLSEIAETHFQQSKVG